MFKTMIKSITKSRIYTYFAHLKVLIRNNMRLYLWKFSQIKNRTLLRMGHKGELKRISGQVMAPMRIRPQTCLVSPSFPNKRPLWMGEGGRGSLAFSSKSAIRPDFSLPLWTNPRWSMLLVALAYCDSRLFKMCQMWSINYYNIFSWN